jgi:hypothetical protein
MNANKAKKELTGSQGIKDRMKMGRSYWNTFFYLPKCSNE